MNHTDEVCKFLRMLIIELEHGTFVLDTVTKVDHETISEGGKFTQYMAEIRYHRNEQYPDAKGERHEN
jgi:hypothetical protein